MSEQKKALPSKIHLPSDEIYLLVIAKIGERDERGRIKDITLYYDDDILELVGGEEFLTTYIADYMLKEPNGEAKV